MLKDPLIDREFLKEITESREPVHGIVQLHSLPRPGDLRIIGELGIDLLDYLSGITAPGTAYLASISPGLASEDPRFEELVRGLQRLVADDKLETGLLLEINSPNPASEPIGVLVLFFDNVTAQKATAVFTRNGLEARRQGESKTWEASASPDQIRALAEEDVVQWIEPGPGPYLPTVDVARALSNVDQVQQLNIATGVYAGLSGTGVQIGIMDTGVDDHHNDFAGRIIRMQHGGDNHGTLVAGIAAGSGVQSNGTNDATPPQPNGGTAFQWRGMAPRAGIAAYEQIGGNAGRYADVINNLGVDITNHSYVLEEQGLYSGDVANVDGIVRGDSPGIPPRPVVWAAGNNANVGPRDCDGDMMTDGNFPQYPFPNVPPGGPCPTAFQAGYFSVLAPCKNCIVVASVDDNQRHSSFSGLGPTMDGRLKPDVSANGQQNGVIATGGDTDVQGNPVPGNDYEPTGGTSMAAPVVTGIIALML
jgi:subtilisin family serine protease